MSNFDLNLHNNKPNTANDLAGIILSSVPQIMQNLRQLNRKNRDKDLSLIHFRILANLTDSPKTNKELAEIIGLSVAATSRSVLHLYDKKLVSKSCNNQDRRETFISLSALGEKFYENTRRKTQDDISRIIGSLSANEIQSVSKALEQLNACFSNSDETSLG